MEYCYVDGVTIVGMSWWFERTRDKDHGDMTQNPACVTITRSIFMNKKKY